ASVSALAVTLIASLTLGRRLSSSLFLCATLFRSLRPWSCVVVRLLSTVVVRLPTWVVVSAPTCVEFSPCSSVVVSVPICVTLSVGTSVAVRFDTCVVLRFWIPAALSPDTCVFDSVVMSDRKRFVDGRMVGCVGGGGLTGEVGGR